MDNPFSWEYLTTRPGENEVFGPFAVLYLIVFGLGFLVTVIIYNGGARRAFPNPVLHQMARRWSGIAVALFGLGLFFFGVRALQITLLTFEMRIWMWLSILSVLLFACYVAYDYGRHYAPAMKEFEERKVKQQYMRTSSGGAVAFPAKARPVRRRRR
jgi:hypothetical protein